MAVTRGVPRDPALACPVFPLHDTGINHGAKRSSVTLQNQGTLGPFSSPRPGEVISLSANLDRAIRFDQAAKPLTGKFIWRI